MYTSNNGTDTFEDFNLECSFQTIAGRDDTRYRVEWTINGRALGSYNSEHVGDLGDVQNVIPGDDLMALRDDGQFDLIEKVGSLSRERLA